MFSVVFIVRDEAASLPGALDSLGPVPDLVVCDTGSQDETVAVARAFDARIAHFPWCDDFAAARTFAETHARYDWVVRFDADERIRPWVSNTSFSSWLSPFIARAEDMGGGSIFVRRHYRPGNEHWFPRIYRRSRFRWHFPVHELLEPRDGTWPQSLSARGVIVDHERQHRPRPYRRILEKAVLDAPQEPYLLFHLGNECFEEKDHNAAATWLMRYLTLPGGYPFHRSEARMLLGHCSAAKRDMAAAFDHYEAASKQGPRAEPLWHAARLALEFGDLERARDAVERGRTMALPRERQPFGEDDHPYLLDRRLYDAKAWDVIAMHIVNRMR